MHRIRWAERPITFRSLVDNPTIQKPALVQIGTKSIIVGDKISGQFIVASPCKLSNNQFDTIEEDIVLSNKHTGLWRVLLKATPRRDNHIHRLTTKDIETIYKKDFQNQRTFPRSYISTKRIEAFELHDGTNDSSILNGYRTERRLIYIEENVEFQIDDIGEIEYTPTEGERTSQDYIMIPKTKSNTILQFLIPNIQEQEEVIRNRVLRSLYCTIKNKSYKRSFLLEVNEQPCDIHPIASDGSTELRYLHSTQNLFDYMSKYENDISIYVKLIRGDLPTKAIDYDGYMVFKSVLNGDTIPICSIEDLQITLTNPNLPVQVKLPIDNKAWYSLPKIHAAELQCMQLALALLARHESDIYITDKVGKTIPDFLQSTNDQQRYTPLRQSSDTMRNHLLKHKSEDDLRSEERKKILYEQPKIFKSQTPTLSRATPFFHPASDQLYRNEEKRLLLANLKASQQYLKEKEKRNQNARKTALDRSILSSIFSTSNRRTKNKHDSK
ncbi:unnamed protein product [Adineta steineri]|uniref:CABIT domain-containing protein n=1 Tax=Adineta steineri TaxID=433720 RepID=A0A818Q4B0_9BILA|nr:unnamed protein product [Adineta steineri]